MGFGTFGSTLNDELNRLANGGTYRDMDDMVDEALAAKQWANLENITPYTTDTVGVLNEIAGLGPNRQNWFDFNGVCNYLAGTTGLPAAAALRQITTTGDILTSLAAYYIDATDASASTQTITNLGSAGSLLPTTLGSTTSADSNDPAFLAHTGTNYVYLPGVLGNNMSVPDAAALDITGDIDLRALVALDDWTPSTINAIVNKRGGTASDISYDFRVTTTGNLSLLWSVDGINTILVSSSVTAGITDGSIKWIRATLDVDNGASGYDVKFFTSDNGTVWTQLGSTVTGSGTTSIYSGTSEVRIGQSAPSSTNSTGKFYRAQILNGIDGTTVLDVDASVIATGAATSFTATTGQTVTINRTTSGRKTVAVTQPTWLFGTDDIMAVDNRYMSGAAPHLYLPGINLNAATTPDAAVLDITGDIDLRCKVSLDDWTPSTLGVLISKYGAAGNRSYQFYVNTTGTLEIAWTADGTTALTSTSTVAPTVVDGATLWVRATLDVNNGASGNTTTFFTSTDGTTWTQLGTTVVKSGTTSIYSGTAQLAVGANSQSTLTQTSRGDFFRAQVLNGIDGTVAFDANFETSITSLEQASFTESSANAATVTINRSGTTYRSAGITQAGYLYPGATNTFSASATDFLNHGLNSFSYGLVYRQWNTPTSNARIFYKGGITAGRYLVNNSAATLAAIAGINDGVTANQRATSTPASGTLNELVTVVNRNNLTVINYFNNEIGTTTTLTAGSADNPLTLSIGTSSGAAAGYADMELVAAYVFRQALTAAQIRQITNYFMNREAYL